MDKDVSRTFESCFIELKDPRVERTKLYPLIEILFVVLCGSICGAESWRDYVDFGRERLDFLKEYYAFKNGIPSKNTFSRVFSALDPELFKQCFVEWVKSLQEVLNEVIAIDGKTLCNSADKVNGRSAIHMVSAFATGAKLILAQQVVDEKSNEITAIPKLLELLDLRGHTITIDAMGTQKAIAKQIIDQGGDYILALKGNQGTLNEDVRLFLETEVEKTGSMAMEDRHYDVDKGHGRIETRQCFVSEQIDWLSQKGEWAGLKTVVMIEETQEMKGKISRERRFFISSLPPEAERIASAVRSHWLVESNVHWVLDVVFNEDQSRVRKDNAAENMAFIRHITLNMLNNVKKKIKNVGLKALRKRAGWGNNTLRLILRQNF
jgi:predicted transposase YbfD/YdcC